MAEPVKKAALKKITLKGFKSIESLVDFELGNLNVLIGANGAGKSNFVDFFRMLRAMAQERLQGFILEAGGVDGLLYLGSAHTRQITARVELCDVAYEFALSPTAGDKTRIDQEEVRDLKANVSFMVEETLESNLRASALGEKNEFTQQPDARGIFESIHAPLENCMAYHFHDTSIYAPMRRHQPAYDNKLLRGDASNIAAFLRQLRQKHKGSYDLIRDTVRLIAPFFDDFILEIETFGPEEKVKLAWRQKGSDFPFQPFHLSDGTIRFICLATALLQPVPPTTIVIDEPELGLHPYAIAVLGGLIRSAAARTQVIVTTQSPALLDQFEPEDVIVVSREQGCSMFKHLDVDELREWRNDYSVGELWEKNVLRAGPVNE
jgi:predicted ATPase